MFKASFKSKLSLSPFTTLGLGGKASFFFRAKSLDGLHWALSKAQAQGLPVLILGGGSNLIIPDEGFDGLVIKIELRGMETQDRGSEVCLSLAAGEDWDSFVKKSIAMSLGGLECLSGIPGLLGATPIQNIGAYGQELSDSIESIECLDLKSLAFSKLSAAQCSFSYRSSIFKRKERGSFVITRVNYVLRKNYIPKISYEELKKRLEQVLPKEKEIQKPSDPRSLRKYLKIIREEVIKLRRSKGMLIDPRDPESRSVGSFFINPILNLAQYEDLKERSRKAGSIEDIPAYPLPKEGGEGGRVKVPAAWLIERAGFGRGFRQAGSGVGISKKHSLALVNYEGTTKELLALASTIQNKVEELYGIQLEREAALAAE